MDTERTFGVEFECVNLSREAAILAFHGAGIELGYERRGDAPDGWIFKNDGSLSDRRGNGHTCEVCSPPLFDLEELARGVEVLRAAGARVNQTCGMHVHMEARDLGLEAWRRLFRLWLRYEPALDALISPKRRGSASRHCQSNLLIGEVGAEPGAPISATMCLAIDRAKSVMDFTRIWSSRYVKLNPHAFGRHGTVEFRGHQGCITTERVRRWVMLLDHLMFEAAYGQRDVPRSYATVGELIEVMRLAAAGTAGARVLRRDGLAPTSIPPFGTDFVLLSAVAQAAVEFGDPDVYAERMLHTARNGGPGHALRWATAPQLMDVVDWAIAHARGVGWAGTESYIRRYAKVPA